jgi:MFS family permease
MKVRIRNVTGPVIVLFLSLLLLVYVGYGEANRTYPGFQFDKLSAQGEILKTSIETYLQSGSPLKRYIGFAPLTSPILDADASISEIRVVSGSGKTVFTNGRSGATVKPISGEFTISNLDKPYNNYRVFENDHYYKIVLPLNNKFEAVGQLWITTPKLTIKTYLNTHFTRVLTYMAVLLVIFAGLFMLFEKGLSNTMKYFQEMSFGLAFAIMSIIVVLTLVTIFTTGIQGKTGALANSLAKRLDTALELGLELDDFTGLDEVFQIYKDLNSDISDIGITENEAILIHSDTQKVGKTWLNDTSQYVVDVQMGDGKNVKLVHVGIPKKAIYSKLARSIKNFVVLFAASAFLAFLFLNIQKSLAHKQLTSGTTEEKVEMKKDFALGLIKPAYFLAVFIEGLHASFLPQFFKDLTLSSGLNESYTSLLFTVFFASFALSLIPAGRYAEIKGTKRLIVMGFIMTTVLQFLMAFSTDFYSMFIIRTLAGVGQGVLFIGVQSFILNNAVKGRKTQGAAIIVFGYNGGIISGAAIGGLLIGNIGYQMIFFLEAAIALFSCWYVLRNIVEHDVSKASDTLGVQSGMDGNTNLNLGDLVKSIVTDMGKVLKDFQFFKALVLVGLPTKAVLTGVTIFALPLLLSHLDYVKEDIGQILMFYAAGVLLSSKYVSRITDRIGKTSLILFIGSFSSGIGLILIGITGWEVIVSSHIPFLSTLVLILGMSILGLAHGFIHAPVITHISSTPVASQLGAGSTASVYRFMERIGHVIGPIIVGYILIITGYSSLAISWIGVAFLIIGILFIFEKKQST